MGFYFIMMCPSYHLIEVSPLFLDMGYLFCVCGIQHPPVNGCSIADCNFGIITGGAHILLLHHLEQI